MSALQVKQLIRDLQMQNCENIAIGEAEAYYRLSASDPKRAAATRQVASVLLAQLGSLRLLDVDPRNEDRGGTVVESMLEYSQLPSRRPRARPRCSKNRA
jgi:hypothetical protein